MCPRRLRACLGVLVELSAPSTGSASAPRRGKMRGRDHRWCAGGNRSRHPSNGAGRIAAGRDGGSRGGRSSLDSAGRSQRCRRSVRGSGPTGARRAGGGGVAGAALAPVGPARGCRQRRDCPDWHRVCDRVQDAHVRCAPPGPRPSDGRRGFTGIAGVGVGEERSRCCAWCVPAGWRGSRTGFLWSRLIAWFRFSGPAREPHRGPGSWLRSLRPAEREALLGSLAAGSGVGGAVREHGGEEEVREAVGDRLGHRRCVAVEGADRQRGEPSGLLGVLDRGWRLGGRRGVP